MIKNKKVKMNSFIPKILPNSGRGLSGVIATVIMIALAIVLISIVWVVVDNLVRDKLNKAGSCLDILGAITIDYIYTCYDPATSYFQFSIGVGDADVSSVLVSISGEGQTKSFTITNTPTAIPNLANYESTNFGSDDIVLPDKNAGLTYVANSFSGKPDLISLTPSVDGQQCEISDSSYEIENCLALS